MAPNLPIDEAHLVASFMEDVAYGIFLVSFGFCIRVLLFTKAGTLKQTKRINWPVLAATLLMATFATLNVSFDLRFNIVSFVLYTGPGGAKVAFSRIGEWVNVMKSVDYVVQTLIGDGMLMYRTYFVYNKDWRVVAFPMLMWAGCIAAGVCVAWVEIMLHNGATLTDSRLTHVITAFLALTLTLNLICTSLIVYRLWRIHSQVAPTLARPSTTAHAIRVIVDSGLIYTTWVVMFFGTSLAHSNGQYGVSETVVQVIPITFNLITIRVGRGIATGVPSTVLQPANRIPLRIVKEESQYRHTDMSGGEEAAEGTAAFADVSGKREAASVCTV